MKTQKRILITSTDVMMFQFLLPHALHLIGKGYAVDVACSSAEGYQKEGYLETIRERLPKDSRVYPVDTQRSPFSLRNIRGYRQLRTIIREGRYDLIWTNEPVMGVMTRLAAREARKKDGTRVFYLVHGYHFYRGAPKKNWMYYPVEKFMSRYCDCMGMINWEDYGFTRKKMPRMRVEHIDGIGFDISRFRDAECSRDAKRAELGIAPEDCFVLSVGELQTRKNHEPVIRAVAKLNDPHVKYCICGRGELLEPLQKLCRNLNIENQVRFLGHRYDIREILKAADIFAHPSLREGLGIAALEAMAAGLPLVTSDIQGIKDFMEDGKTGYCFSPSDVDGYAKAIALLMKNKELRASIGKYNQTAVQKYSLKNSMQEVETILKSVLEE